MICKKPKILIVEDDLLSRLNLKSRLESVGEVIEASSKEVINSVVQQCFFDNRSTQ